jgi:photosystem II stability/assembly factor-like uncharacterized protein
LTWENKNRDTIGILRKIYFSSANVGFLLSDAVSTNLYKSTDGGEIWVQKVFSYPFNDVWFINHTRGIAAGGWASECFHCLDTRGAVFVTDDGGRTWEQRFETGIIESCCFLNKDVGYILSWEWILGAGWAGLLGTISKTTDAGSNWTDVYQDNRDPEGYFFTGNDLCFMNEQLGWSVGNYVENYWAESGAGILGTEDGGDNWDLIWKYQDTYNTLKSITTIDTVGWSVGENGMIVKYTDRNKWQIQTNVTDLPLNEVFFSDDQHGWIAGGYFNNQNSQSILLITKNAGQTWNEIKFDKYLINDLYFADSLHGWAVGSDTSGLGTVLNSRDGGVNWITQVEGLSAPLTALHVKGDNIWAVGENGLVLKSDIASEIWIDEKYNKNYPTYYSLNQNYPNPFNPETTIHYQLPASGDVQLGIYNVLGQKVSTLVSERQRAGSYEVTWDASGFTSGVYYYRIEVDEFQDVKKMILIK